MCICHTWSMEVLLAPCMEHGGFTTSESEPGVHPHDICRASIFKTLPPAGIHHPCHLKSPPPFAGISYASAEPVLLVTFWSLSPSNLRVALHTPNTDTGLLWDIYFLSQRVPGEIPAWKGAPAGFVGKGWAFCGVCSNLFTKGMPLQALQVVGCLLSIHVGFLQGYDWKWGGGLF
jgi:hypothetical protein